MHWRCVFPGWKPGAQSAKPLRGRAREGRDALGYDRWRVLGMAVPWLDAGKHLNVSKSGRSVSVEFANGAGGDGPVPGG